MQLEFFYAPLIIDERPIRDEALRTLQGAQSELERLNRELAEFNGRDKPAFANWFQATFRELLSTIQDTVTQVHERRLLVEEIMQEAEKRGISYSEAYERVVRRKDRGQALNDDEEEEAAQFDLFNEALRAHGIEPDELGDEERARLYDRFQAYQGFTEEAPAESKAKKARSSNPRRLKELYRLLARQLHPDAAGAQSERSHELWLEVQVAYESGDVQRLERIWATFGENSEDPSDRRVSVSDLYEMLGKVLDSIHAMHKRMKGARRDRAWGFRNPRGGANRKKTQRALERELLAELDEAQQAFEALENFIERCVRN